MSNYKIYDVAVIGGGVMGSATAYYLSKHTKNVILLEQFDFLHRRGSSHGDSRIIRMTYPQDYYTELMQSSYKLWSDAEKEAGMKVFTKTGGLDFGREDNPELRTLIKGADKYKVRHEILKPLELSHRFPMLQIPEEHIAVYTPSSGILNATKAVGMFQNLARARGVTLRDNCKIKTISKDVFYMELVSETGEIFRARKCIFTTGPWTKKILKENLALDLPLTPVQTTIAYWKVDNPKEYSSETFPVFINYENPFIYGTPAHEFPNLIKCAAHYGKEIHDPDQRDFEPGRQALRDEVSPFLQNYFKRVDPVPVMTESCIYTWSPDHDFIIDKIPDSESLFVGCGFSGHGFKLAPIVGHILSELVLKGKHPYPRVQEKFSINRLKLNKHSKL